MNVTTSWVRELRAIRVYDTLAQDHATLHRLCLFRARTAAKRVAAEGRQITLVAVFDRRGTVGQPRQEWRAAGYAWRCGAELLGARDSRAPELMLEHDWVVLVVRS